jgi:K(+)-stimulated pyrophosphate-energized sodium pump
VTELSLILTLDFIVVLASLGLVRWVFAHDTEPSEARGLLTALRGAVSSFRLRQGKRGLLLVAAAAWLTIAVGSWLGASHSVIVYAGSGVVLGALLNVVVGQLALGFGARSAAATATVLRVPSSSAAVLALRGGALIALAIEVSVSLLSTVVLAATLLATGQDLASGLPNARAMLAGVAFGSVAAVVVAHWSGSAVASAGEFGLHQLRGTAPNRFPLEPQNPALVVSACGPHLGTLLARAHDATCLSVLAHGISLSAALTTIAEGSAGTASSLLLALVALPLLVRTAGLLASAVAVLSLRADDSDDPVVLLSRGQLAAAVMTAAGMAGACRWLLGAGAWVSAFGIGLLGLLLQLAVALGARLLVERRSPGLSQLRESANASAETTSGLGFGISGIFTALSLLGVTIVIAIALALGGTWPAGGGFVGAASLALAGFLSTLTFSLALGLLEPVVESACGLASLGSEGQRPQTQARLSALDFAGVACGSLAQSHISGASVLLTVAAALVVWAEPLVSHGLSMPLLLTATLVGVGLVIVLCALAVRHSAKTVLNSQQETARQLRGLHKDERGLPQVPNDFSPSYKDQLTRVTDGALSGLLTPALLTLVVPLLLGAGVQRFFDTAQLQGTLVFFLVAQGVTGFMFASVSGAALGLLGAARRHSRAAHSAQQYSLNRADLFAHALGSSVGPAARLAVAAATAAGMMLVAMAL